MEKNEKKIYQKWWFWIIIIILIAGILGGSSDNNTNNTNSTNITNSINSTVSETSKSNIFLKGSNGKEFYEILCDVGQVPKKEGVIMGDCIDYASSNENYGIELETNKDNEINWISIYTLFSSDYDNFFLAVSRLEYNNSNKSECFNWIKENLGKESTIKIGDANFKLYNGTSGKPILEIYTDGNEEYQKEQLKQISQ